MPPRPPAGASSSPQTPLIVIAFMRRARLISQSPLLRLSWSLVHEMTESGSPLTVLGACLHESHRLHTMTRGSSTSRREGLACTGALHSLFLWPWSLWQQRRREQILYNHTDSTKEKDPKGQPTERTYTAQRRAKARTREGRQDLDGEQDGAARGKAGAVITRRKQTKRRDERVTPGPNRGATEGESAVPQAAVRSTERRAQVPVGA